jgi:hypothetical protein
VSSKLLLAYKILVLLLDHSISYGRANNHNK